MENGAYFLDRLTHSLDQQTFRDFELVITREGKMAENTNAAILKAKGDIIKILYMDDFLFSVDALQHVSDAFDKGTGWYASACVHTHDGRTFEAPHKPSYNQEIRLGKNTIGSPSVVAFENDDPLLFDENLSWLLDCDLYARLYERYGKPILSNELDVAIGLGPHQVTNIIKPYEKHGEYEYLKKKYG
jgi:hypothetical protein